MSEILDNIYVWLFLENGESVSLLALVKYTFVNLFYPKNSTIDSRLLIFDSGTVGCGKLPDPSLNCICNQVVYNIRSHFNELIMAWNAHERQTG